ncbi:tyrosine decarboxylase-like [Argiope bruennichi]|uniref:tyrosine decarboxylase-like n=1 Tax=Argiope bruennichi TaxID=94029 RepID=UPI0024948E22|nr:tyrosine decarboxylase-like [Argiope bruennichi]
MDVEEYRKRAKELVDYMVDYYINIGKRRVTSTVEPGYLRKLIPSSAPEEGEPWEKIMEDVEKIIMPGVTHWLHPNFNAFFPIGCSFPSLLGEFISDGLAINGFSWASSPCCTELETIVLDWLGEMIGLPDQFLLCRPGSKGGGVLQASASDCNFVVLLAARHQAIKAMKKNDPTAEEGTLMSSLVAYCSSEAHSCVEKAAMICQVKLSILKTDEKFRLRGSTLEEAVKRDIKKGYRPFFVVSTIGTTSCASSDKMNEIGPICEKYGMWLHVDAAYGGNAMICPEMRYILNGIEYATSFNTNPTKWMLVCYDCSAMWVTDRYRFMECLVVNPLYLAHDQQKFALDYRHWGIPLSRRFRSLKLWFTIRSYGIRGLQHYIRNHIYLAKLFEKKVREDERFEIKNEVNFGLVCFRLKGSNKMNEKLLDMINKAGEMYMVATSLGREYVIRYCVCYAEATDQQVNYSWDVILRATNKLLGKK